MISVTSLIFSSFIFWLKTLQNKLHHCGRIWLCCNRTEGNNHSEQLRLSTQQHTLLCPTEDSRLNQTVVSDSTTLISLLNIDRFDLLFKFSKTIIISQAVFDEVSYQNHAKQVLDGFIKDKRVIVKTIKDNKRLPQLLIRLDLGESESILLAKKENLPITIDEKKGRSVATELGLKVIGLIGILLVFKKRGQLSNGEIKDIVNDLRKVEFRVSNSLLEFLLD